MILDTNAVTALSERDAGIMAAAHDQPILHLPVIVLGEYRFGLLGSRHRREYESWLTAFIPTVAVLEIGEETALHYATIRHELRQKGHPIPENDIWIAALSRQHSLPVLTRDAHFDAVPGLRRHSW